LTPEEEGARRPLHLRSRQAWLLGGLVGLAVLNSTFAGIAASRDVPLSDSTQALWWFVFSIIVAIKVGATFGKGGAWSFFLLWLVAFIGYLILGLGDAKYTKPVKA